MKYLCLGYRDEHAWAALSPTQQDALMQEAAAYDDELRRSGHCLEARKVRDARVAATLRFENGKVSVADGPFVQTNQPLGGIMVLEATDLNHAIALMSNLPCMRRAGGSLEIRPIDDQQTSNREMSR